MAFTGQTETGQTVSYVDGKRYMYLMSVIWPLVPTLSVAAYFYSGHNVLTTLIPVLFIFASSIADLTKFQTGGALGFLGHPFSALLITALVAMSSTNGGLPARGTAKAMGLVPKIFFRPPHAATLGGEFDISKARNPASASGSTTWPRIPGE